MKCKVWLTPLVVLSLLIQQSFVPLVNAEEMKPTWGAFRVSDFSPDNSRLFMDACDSANKCGIAALDLRTKKITLLAPRNPVYRFTSPRLSIDGRRLVVAVGDTSAGSVASQIAVLDLTKKTYRVVTTSPTYKQFPSFSPDEKKIVYGQANRERQSGRTRFADWDIYEVDLQRGNEARLTDYCFYAITRPQYMPDGERILFSGEPLCNFPASGSRKESHDAYIKRYKENRIFLRQPNEQNLQPYFTNGVDSYSPLISKDGKRILFISKTNEMDGITCCKYNYDLFLREGGSIKRLTALKTAIRGVAFSADGTLVAYQSDEARNGKSVLWLLNVQSGANKQIGISDKNPFGAVDVAKETFEEAF